MSGGRAGQRVHDQRWKSTRSRHAERFLRSRKDIGEGPTERLPPHGGAAQEQRQQVTAPTRRPLMSTC
jgi:hypothetical protein